jgi:hypothetical protein
MKIISNELADELIKELKELPVLDLPNTSTKAVWLENVIDVIEEHRVKQRPSYDPDYY